MSVPYWVQDAIFYQIFPDRFANGDPGNDPPNVQPWGAEPTIWGFQGGDLRGVIQKFDYVLDLGVNALYFNPIFQATSNHRYNISDYYQIDPKLGDMDDFQALLDVAHSNGIRVILDGVFNHCGRGLFAFNDVLENHSHSPYIDWFHLNHVPPDAYSPGDADDYDAWWKFKSLPKFNTDNPHVRKYIYEVATYWIQQGADGWRLDVPNEIDDDAFWAEFRRVVKSVNQDAYLVGEIWDGNPDWVGDDRFDGLMHYPFREALIGYLSERITAESLGEKIHQWLKQYDQDHARAMYLPLGSHDTRRLATVLEGEREKVKMALLFQFAFLGAPAVYYGDEIGLQGGEDPECRRAFPWQEREWDLELRAFTKRCIDLRKRHPVLRRGSYHQLHADGETGTFAFGRRLGEESILILLNASSSHQRFPVDVGELGWRDGRAIKDLFKGKEHKVSAGELVVELPPWSGTWMR